ncbi:MAG: ABC transporter permease [Candidatus Tectomicrobia bacterium]|nr:ABC transporter permease [Candidatus Tectomicrobia bacterium]
METTRGQTKSRGLRGWKGAIFLLCLIGLWEMVARLHLVSALYFPPMSKNMGVFYRLTVDGTLPLQVLLSFGRMFGGYFLAIALMVPLGLAMGLFRFCFNTFEPLVESFRPLCPPAIIPVVMLFLGIGDSMKMFVVFYACSFPILLNTIDGVRNVDVVLVNTARTFGLSRLAIIRKVVLPAASPQIMSGLRISLPISLIVVIVSEMIGSTNGIGHFILLNQRTFNVPETYAGVIMVAMVGYLLNRLFLGFDRRFMHWHRGWSAEQAG